MAVDFNGKVAIVTGAGNGLGRSHALALAAAGARVVVNDLGGDRSGVGQSSAAAQAVVDEIKAGGGEAIANGANITIPQQVEAMVASAMEAWGRVDILINNAGILRDKSFAKMSLEDFRIVVDVHLMGTVNCCKAVWDIMRAQNYGRILVTTSSSGMYGNFGQSNYGAAKMAVLGLMNTLTIEGAKNNIRVNALAPTATTRMTEELVPPEFAGLLSPQAVTAGALAMCAEDAPSGEILCAGAGCYARAKMFESEGIFLPPEARNPQQVQAHWAQISAGEGQQAIASGPAQTERFIRKAVAGSQAAAAQTPAAADEA